MLRKAVRPSTIIPLVLVLGVAGAALAQAGMSLTYKGKQVSYDVRIIGGRPYVPVADVAKLLGGFTARSKFGYDIRVADAGPSTPAGGANQVNGLHGNLGETIFTGNWRFEIISVNRTQYYTTKYSAVEETITPNGNNDELVVITGQLRNAQKVAVAPMFSSVHPHNTSLTDSEGQSYPPIHFDKRGGNSDTGGSMLPGSSTKFAVLFSVPKGTAPKDLVFSLQRFPDDFPDGGTDVRISLGH